MTDTENRLSQLMSDAVPTMDALDFDGIVSRVRRRRLKLAAGGVATTAIVAAALLVPLAATHTASRPVAPVVAKPSAAPKPTPAASPSVDPASLLDAFTSVQFVSTATGWVVGRDGIYATNDGGAHWQQQLTRPDIGLTSLDAYNHLDAWAVGVGQFLRTTDGGARWEQVNENGAELRTVHFFTPTDGYAVAGGPAYAGDTDSIPETGGVVLRTTDGGTTWTQVSAPKDAQSLCFPNSSSGWLGAGGHVYRTTDGAATWQESLTLPARTGGITSVECAGHVGAWAETIGPFAAASQSPHIVFHTDGGAWRPVFAEGYFPYPGVSTSVPNSPGTDGGPFSAIGPDSAFFLDTCDACGYGDVKGASVNGPANTVTTEATLGSLTEVDGVSFTDAEHGWATGRINAGANADGLTTARWEIVATDDSGKTWHTQVQTSGDQTSASVPASSAGASADAGASAAAARVSTVFVPTSTTPTASIASSTPPCLAGVVQAQGGLEGGGFQTTHGSVAFTDIAPHSCELGALTPALSLRTADGTTLAVQEVSPTTALHPVVLQPHATDAEALEFSWQNWCGAAPGALTLVVSLPGSQGVVTVPISGTVPGCTSPGTASTIQVLGWADRAAQ